jgi:hypothetical protein
MNLILTCNIVLPMRLIMKKLLPLEPYKVRSLYIEKYVHSGRAKFEIERKIRGKLKAK